MFGKRSQEKRLKMQEKSEESSKKTKKTKKEFREVRNVQNSIKYDLMMKNGICALPNNMYSSSMRFTDINYQIATDEDQQTIFTKYVETLNSLGNEIDLQLTIHNRQIDVEQFEKDTLLRPKNDNYQKYRNEMNGVLTNNISDGSNKIISEKMITYTVQEDSYTEARRSLRTLDNEFANKFKEMGCEVQVQNGYDRLEVIHSIFNPETKFLFSYDNLGRNFTSKDAIAPDDIDFKKSPHSFEMNDRICKVMYLKNYSTELSDQLIQSLAKLEHNLTISFHMTAIPRGSDVGMVKNKIVQMESQKMDESKKALQRGYDPDMLPMELKLSYEEAEILLGDVQRRNQRLFECQFMIMLNAKTEVEFKATQKAVETAIKKLTCELGTLSWRQEEGLNGILPLGVPISGLARTLTTSVCAIIMPFTSQELMQRGESIYYGLNAITKNMILCNRKSLQNPSGWVLGKPGGGKSFAVKREIANVFLATKDDLVVIDPENEYKLLTQAFGGSTINVDTKSGVHLNPFAGDMDEPDFLSSKAEFAQTITAEIVGGGKLNSIQQSIIDSCIRKMYDEYLVKKEDKTTGIKVEMPNLNDLVRILKENSTKEAQMMVVSYEMYTGEGSYNLFSGSSNVDTNNRMTTYNILDLGATLQPLAMQVVLETLWQKIIFNFKKGVRTWIWIDEIYLLLKSRFSEDFLYQLFKRARKFGAVITGITQNVEDLLNSDKARTMLSNSEFILMLNQASSDRDQLADLLNISKEQLSYVSSAQKGSGLLFNGKHVIPFEDKFPKDTELYELFTTDFDEKKKISQGIALT